MTQITNSTKKYLCSPEIQLISMKKIYKILATVFYITLQHLVILDTSYAEVLEINYKDGGRYTGEIQQGKRHGKGVLIFPDGKRYEGEFQEGKEHGNGTLTFTSGDRYEGEFRNSTMHGKGVYYFANGGRYDGDISENSPHGKGVLVYKNGTRYEGDFYKGKEHGKGVKTFTDGRYEGDFKSGRMHGKGIMFFDDYARYDGDFFEGNRQGTGVMVYSGGDRYEGDFHAGHEDGKGVLIYSSGARYEGDFTKGKRTGKGVMLYKDGGRYEGDFYEGKKHGNGTFYSPSGQSYSGGFQNDLRHGDGVLSFANGARYEGQFFQGARQGKGKMLYSGGERYEGDFFEDKEHGNGIFASPNGANYKGEYSRGKWDGLGVLKTKDGRVSEGLFKEGKFTSALSIEKIGPCNNPSIPNPSPLKNETADFYGVCNKTNDAHNGIVVWKIQNLPYDIQCLNDGKFTDPSSLDSFKPCSSFWALVPNYCNNFDYHGQCNNTYGEGVGFKSGQRGGEKPSLGGGVGGALLSAFAQKVNYTLYIERGMFKSDKLNGYGIAYYLNGCGMAGCSGTRVAERGWFKDGKKMFDCAHYSDCLTKLSGQDLAEQKRILSSLNSHLQLKTSGNGNIDDFNNAISKFESDGKKENLKRAQELAKSDHEKSRLEFALMQVTGFNKAFLLKSKTTSGEKSFSINASEHLAGFVRSVRSGASIQTDWSIRQNKSILPLKFGRYEVILNVGVELQKTDNGCIGSICTKKVDVHPYIKKASVILDNKNGYSDSGTYRFDIDAASRHVLFISESASEITAITPVLTIEAVKLLP